MMTKSYGHIHIRPQEKGIIELESSFVSNLIENYTEFALKGRGKKELREFFKQDPKGEDLYVLRKYRNTDLVRSFLFFYNHVNASMEKTAQIIKNGNLSFSQLLNNWFSYLYDASCREYFGGSDESKRFYTNVRDQEVTIRRSVLANISWYTNKKKYYGLEYTGLLTGVRNRDLSIKEVTNFIPIKSGDNEKVMPTAGEIAYTYFSEELKDEPFVGWYHSHPYNYPVYSNLDKATHLFNCYIFSIIRAMNLTGRRHDSINIVSWLSSFELHNILYLLRAAEGLSNRDYLLKLVLPIAQYIIDIQKKTRFIVSSGGKSITAQEMEKLYEDYFSLVNKNFPLLKQKVDRILKKHKKELAPEIEIELLPTCGLIVCPESRYIAAIDCSNNTKLSRDFSNGWYYYRVNPSC